MEILNIKNLSFKYNGTDKEVLTDVSFSLNEGELLLLCGETGSGKSTLLRLIKKELAPAGERSGEILFRGRDVGKNKSVWDGIGLVTQNPAAQIVTDSVYGEIAFGSESIGIEPEIIRLRVAETAQYFGLEDSLSERTDTLSGGKQQLLNLAAVMAMRPALLLLDEPTSQLDPIAAREFISAVRALAEDAGTAVIIAEHRLEEIFPVADKVLALKNGKVYAAGTPQSVAAQLGEGYMTRALPTAARIFTGLGGKGETPLTVREGRRFLQTLGKGTDMQKKESTVGKDEAVSLSGVFFRYEKKSPDVLSDLTLTLYAGELLSIIGGNATGKSTLLSLIAGLRKPYMGRVKLFGKLFDAYKNPYRDGIAYLPQDVTTVFIADSVEEDCCLNLKDEKMTNSARDALIGEKAALLGIEHKLSVHPYDLSGGERQKAALLKILLLNPRVLLLDEPTRGIDPTAKEELGKILRELCAEGVAVLTATHDIEFAAEFSESCAQLSQGKIIARGSPRTIFSENSFYTTAAARISRGKCTGAVLADEVISCFRHGGKYD